MKKISSAIFSIISIIVFVSITSCGTQELTTTTTAATGTTTTTTSTEITTTSTAGTTTTTAAGATTTTTAGGGTTTTTAGGTTTTTGSSTTTTTNPNALNIISITPSATTTVESVYPTIEVTFSESMKSPEYGWFEIDGTTVQPQFLSGSGTKITIYSLTGESSSKLADGLHTLEVTTNAKSTNEKTLSANYLHRFYTHTPNLAGYFLAGGTSDFYFNPPIMDESGNIYIGTSHMLNENPAPNNYFYKLDANLNEVWSYNLGTNEVRGAAVRDSNGNIYFAAEKGRLSQSYGGAKNYLYQLNSSGAKQWEVEIPSFIDAWGFYCPVVSASNVIYVGGQGLYAYDSDGNSIAGFPYKTQLDMRNAPIIDASGNIYFVAADTNYSPPSIEVHCVNSSGSLIWKSNSGKIYNTINTSSYFSSPAFDTTGTKVIAAINSTVYCLNTSNGSEVWHTTDSFTGKFMASPVVDADNNVYIGTKANEDSAFYAINGSNGSLLWTYDAGVDVYCTPALGNDGMIYAGHEISGSVASALTVLNKSNGAVVQDIVLPFGRSVMLTSPLIASDGTLYIATMRDYSEGAAIPSGVLLAFETEANGLLSGAGWPRFHGGNAGTGRK